MSAITEQLVRLKTAVQSLEQAMAVREAAHSRALETARETARSDTDAIAARVDQAIARLEAVLEG